MNNTRSDILLKEKVAQIDDINFDKIYDVTEFAEKQVEQFSNTDNIDLSDVQNLNNVSKSNNYFEMEVQQNEFLDNHVWNLETNDYKKQKKEVANKPLIVAFTSIAVLLCILLFYNVFVINSLSNSVNSSAKINTTVSNSIYVGEKENNYISFENSENTIVIESNTNTYSELNNEESKTNWFDAICSCISSLFGG